MKAMANDICTSAEVTEQFSWTESYGTPEKSCHDDDSGTPAQPMNWKEKSRRVFDKNASMNVALKFLWTDMQYDYNYMMNHVDWTDQLRGSYQVDKWTRNRKWCWSIWMWGIETLLVIACIFYRETHHLMWKTKKQKLLTHYQF